MIEVYTPGIKAWFPDEELAWVSTSVISKEQDSNQVKITFQDDVHEDKVRSRFFFFFVFFIYFIVLGSCV